jgi:D-sedoheptulose 7-phosphate isomerase
VKNYFLEDLRMLQRVLKFSDSPEILENFEKAVLLIVEALKRGDKIMTCGNGGSASDAEHMVGEIVGRFGYDRNSLPGISLTAPTATFTAIANDYGYENVFKRQVEGLGKFGDVLLGISTSGNSQNIFEAMKVASQLGIKTIALTGQKDSKLSEIADITFKAPSTQTPRIQEFHGLLIHSLCKALEQEIFPKEIATKSPLGKIISEDQIPQLAEHIKGTNSVFTNGCFDVLHPGHVYILKECRSLGELLIVGLNTDDSIKRLKGPSRPVHNFMERASVLAALEAVDYVVGFSDDTPLTLIEALTPKILVKGGDYTKETIVGTKWVEDHGGEVKVIPLLDGHSTTGILEKNGK